MTGEQGVRDSVVVDIVLDTVHDHVVHVPRDIQRGEPAGEADPREDQLRPADQLQPRAGREPAAVERRGERVFVEDHAGAERSPFDPVPGQQEHHQDEAGAQGGQDVGHHHGHVHRMLVALLPVVRNRSINRPIRHSPAYRKQCWPLTLSPFSLIDSVSPVNRRVCRKTVTSNILERFISSQATTHKFLWSRVISYKKNCWSIK